MIRLGIIALVYMAMTYGHNLKDLHRLEPLFRPANVLKGVRGGNYAVDGSPGGANVEARGDESSSGTDDKRQRDFGNEEVIIEDPNAGCGGYIPKEIEEAFGKRSRTTPGSEVTKNEEQSNDNDTINYLVTIIETTVVEGKNETIGQVDNGNDSDKKVEVLRQCIGIPVTPHFILTVTNCCTQCKPISQRQAKKGKKERNSEPRRRPRDNNKRRQMIQKTIEIHKNPKLKDILIMPGLIKASLSNIEVDISPKALRPRSIHILPECAERMSSSRKDYPVECPVLMGLVRPLSPEIVMPICLPVNKTFDLHTQMIASIGLGKKQGWQKEPSIVTDIYPLDSFECKCKDDFEKLPKDIIRTQADDVTLSKDDEGSLLVVYTPKSLGYEGNITGIALLIRAGFNYTLEELPGIDENDEGKNLGKTDMKDKGSREAVKRQNVDIWLSLDCYMDWIIETTLGVNQPTLGK